VTRWIFHQRDRLLEDVVVDALMDVAHPPPVLLVHRGIGVVDVALAVRAGLLPHPRNIERLGDDADVVGGGRLHRAPPAAYRGAIFRTAPPVTRAWVPLSVVLALKSAPKWCCTLVENRSVIRTMGALLALA
jgi:hypothetical protein